MTLTQTRYLTKHARRRVTRQTYPTIERNPVRIISWATADVNIGGITRLAEAFLVEHCAFLKTPAKASSVGTDRWQPFDTTNELIAMAQWAKALGWPIIALEQTDQSHILGLGAAEWPDDGWGNGRDVDPGTELPFKVCFLIGEEGNGLPQEALDLADWAVEIEQFGLVGSLNVVTATGILLYEWSRQHRAEAHSIWREKS